MEKNINEVFNELVIKYKEKNQLDLLYDYLNDADSVINNIIKNREERQIRKNILLHEKEGFIYNFLKENKIYYISDINTFIMYNDNNNNYEIIDESKVWLYILQGINKNKFLLPWKHKVRIELVAKLKKNTIDKCIPESSTIQTILQLFIDVCCENRYYAKYLLTLIGDSIQKKNNNQIFLINPDLLVALNELEYKINSYMKCTITSTFKTKFFNHNYNDLRLFKHNSNANKPLLWLHLLKNKVFDIIIVAIHYSNRYENADNYIKNICNCNITREDVLFLTNNNEECIVDMFIKEYIITNTHLKTNINELTYLFSLYLKEKKYPKMMFNSTFSSLILDKYKDIYDASNNIFNGITSPYLDYIQNFCKFINTTVLYNETEYAGQYYEVTELIEMYSDWNLPKRVSLEDSLAIELIKHFYPKLSIENGIIYNIKNKLWNKEEQLERYYKITKDAIDYKNYILWCKENNEKYTMSKQYFEENIV